MAKRLTWQSKDADGHAVPSPERPKVAAIYCRISSDKEETKVGVARQEADCREVAQRMGYAVPEDFVFVDNSKSAWQRNRKRPGWDTMIEHLNAADFDAVICYHPDRLMRQPRDLEDLLDGADTSRARGRFVKIVGQAANKDLSNPDDVFVLRIEVAHAARSSDDTSRRVMRTLADNAAAGRVHGGVRGFGYRPGNMEIDEAEAAIVREIVERVLKGDGFRTINNDLNARGVLTSTGKQWSDNTIRALISGTRIAGLRQHRGQIVGKAAWPAIIDVGTWTELQEAMEYRAAAYAQGDGDPSKRTFYLLRGLVRCGKCGSLMSGEKAGLAPSYRCRKQQTRHACGERRIMATQLEEMAVELALAKLSGYDLASRKVAGLDEELNMQLKADEAQMQELAAMWANKEMSTDEYRMARAVIQDRMSKISDSPVIKPLRALTGLTGKAVYEKWPQLSPERKNAVLRAVFKSIVINEARYTNRFDPDRAVPELAI